MVRVTDTFLFSEPFEKELLLLKFIHEDPIVDMFVGIESEYTFRGQYKGAHLLKIVSEDPRFKPFKEKVVVITCRENMCHAQHESEYCFVSDNQRSFAQQYVFERFSDNDYVLITDTDEFIDGTNEFRKNKFHQLLSKNEPLDIERVRYWYDLDNRGYFDSMDISIPAFPIWALKNGRVSWKDRKWKGVHIPHYDREYLAFEYSSCFSKEDIWRKHDTFAHDRFTPADLDNALLYNHWIMRNHAVVDINNYTQWFEQVKLTQQNSTKYIIENLDKLKTNVVNPNYKEARHQKWPDRF